MFAIRNSEWKLELCAGSGGWSSPKDAEALQSGAPKVQLYKMSTDERETTNVEAANKPIVETLSKQLETVVNNGRSTPGKPQTNDVPITIMKESKHPKKSKKQP